MQTISDLLLLGLLLLLITVPVATRAYHAGQEAGYTTGLEKGLSHQDTPRLEILDTYQSGRVFWRYGTGETTLTGFCNKAVYPAEALDTVASYHNLAEQTRHQDAADELIDAFLASRGPFRNVE